MKIHKTENLLKYSESTESYFVSNEVDLNNENYGVPSLVSTR